MDALVGAHGVQHVDHERAGQHERERLPVGMILGQGARRAGQGSDLRRCDHAQRLAVGRLKHDDGLARLHHGAGIPSGHLGGQDLKSCLFERVDGLVRHRDLLRSRERH